jgi:hypothetical protein
MACSPKKVLGSSYSYAYNYREILSAKVCLLLRAASDETSDHHTVVYDPSDTLSPRYRDWRVWPSHGRSDRTNVHASSLVTILEGRAEQV